MTETKRPLKVFLCHASADKPAVRDLYKRLIADGVDVWLDAESLIAGQNWQVEIPKAIRDSDVVIVCLSTKSVNKEGYVQKEIKFALDVADEKPEGTIFIVPTRLEDCEVPNRLSIYHWVDLFEETGYKRIMLALNEKAKRIDADFELQKEYVAFTTSDKFFVKEIVEELEKQEEKPSFLKKFFLSISNFIQQRNVKLNLRNQISKNIQRFFGIFVLIVIGLIAIYGLPPLLSFEKLESTPIATSTSSFATFTSSPTSKPQTAIFVPTKTLIPAPTPLPTEITDAKGVSMMLVPAGKFSMGSEDGDSDESPARTVYLDSFYMDVYEVTNDLYKACVTAGVCDAPYVTYSAAHSIYYGNLEFNDYPVIYVAWDQAKTYCEWRNARLPTEAEWEKAARGTDGRTYPWGEGIKCSYANYGNCTGNDTTKVGSYEGEKSPYGIYDLSGNVWEWVNDWYNVEYYKNSPDENPLGPASGQTRVIRGGSWRDFDFDVRSANRSDLDPVLLRTNLLVGFRCAMDAIP